ncbi:MAG: hypothetical protein KAT58_02260 [candidate division Zixibacteria bacterium]|nr:hypothetical protein [candidate division Zixibacteria bacterium]
MKYIALLMIILLSATTFADLTNEYYLERFCPTDYDARARAMGRTGIVNSTGSGSIFYNPANIGRLDGITFQAGARARFGSMDNDDFYDDREGHYWEGKYEFHPKITSVSFAMPYGLPPAERISIAFGIGYNPYYDGASKKNTELQYHSSPGNIYTTTNDIKDIGGLNTISPAVAITFNDQYSVGLAYNKSVMSKKGVRNECSHKSKSQTESTEREFESEFDGSFVTLGVIAQPIPELTIGATYRSGFRLVEKNRTYTFTDADGNKTTKYWEKAPNELPAIIALGVAYHVAPTVLVAGEYQTRTFSDARLYGPKRDIDDGACYRIGVEFQSSVLFRAGMFSDAILITDEDDDTPRTLKGITVGVGIVSNNVTYDFFGEYSQWSYAHEWGTDFGDTKFDYKETHLILGGSITVTLKR